MPNTFFQFKKFIIHQEHCGMKVSTDACIFGAYFSKKLESPENILDIGTGTGLLSLMLAQHQLSNITGIEIETECFQQAQINFNESPWSDKMHIAFGDIKSHQFQKKFDFIISNPPFHDEHMESPNTKKNIAKHGGKLSLHELSIAVSRNISEQGEAGILIPYYRTQEAIDLFQKNGLQLNEKLLLRQTEKHPYFRSILHFKKTVKTDLITSDMTIKTNNQYTPEFIELLKDFYLQL